MKPVQHLAPEGKLDEEARPHADEKPSVESSPDADVEARPDVDEKPGGELSPDDNVEVRPDADEKLDVESSPAADVDADEKPRRHSIDRSSQEHCEEDGCDF